jgi:hypothetical protein
VRNILFGGNNTTEGCWFAAAAATNALAILLVSSVTPSPTAPKAVTSNGAGVDVDTPSAVRKGAAVRQRI